MSSAQRHTRHRLQRAPHWWRVAASLLFATTLPLSSGCDSGTEPRLSGLAGRYVGHWDIWAFDTALTCFLGGCYNGILEQERCQVVTDLIRVGDRSFVGTFLADSTGAGPGSSGGCNLQAGTHWLRPDMRGDIRGGIVDSAWSGSATGAPAKTGANIRFTFGQGNRQDLERLVGCTWLDNSSTWEVRGGWGEAGMLLTEKPQSKSVFYGRVYAPQFQEAILFECQGRAMRVNVDVHGEQ